MSQSGPDVDIVFGSDSDNTEESSQEEGDETSSDVDKLGAELGLDRDVDKDGVLPAHSVRKFQPILALLFTARRPILQNPSCIYKWNTASVRLMLFRSCFMFVAHQSRL